MMKKYAYAHFACKCIGFYLLDSVFLHQRLIYLRQTEDEGERRRQERDREWAAVNGIQGMRNLWHDLVLHVEKDEPVPTKQETIERTCARAISNR